MCAGSPVLNFDEFARDRCFGHTFSNCFDTACCVVGAQLCFKVRATDPGATDDFIRLGEGANSNFLYQISLSQLLAIHTAGADTVWNFGDTMTVCLDLGNLPYAGPYNVSSMIAALQDGTLDFMMIDDTQIDYLELIVQRCCPSQQYCSISGAKFNDLDHDGKQDPGEPGLPGWTINLFYQGGPLYASAVTDANGNYTFANIPCSTYTVSEVNQPGWVQTTLPTAYTVTTAPGLPAVNISFGNWMCGGGNSGVPDTCCVKPPAKMLAWYPLDEAAPATALDLAGHDNNGTQLGSFGFAPGMVGGAYEFGPNVPNLDIVRVYNDPFVTIGPGDFSADAWIHPRSFGANCAVFNQNVGNQPCVDPIFDNRQWFFGGSGLDGVCFFVEDDGQGTGTAFLGLIMSSFPAPQTVFYSPPGTVQLNQWQHVAVTVSRTTGGGTLYLNGAPVATFTPLTGPLYSTNSGPILDIGHGTFLNTGGCYFTNRYFDGFLDEIEIFNRALTPAEVQGLYEAGATGKCKVRCRVPTVVFCKNQTTRPLAFTVCNDGAASAALNWSLAGMASGSGCNFNGAGLVFTPASGLTAPLAPGACTTITVTVTRPAGFNPGAVACYSLSVLNPMNGSSSTCEGQIKAGFGKWCATIIGLPIDPIGIGLGGGSGTARVMVTNDDDPTGSLSYGLQVLDHDGAPSQAVSLNGLQPGEPVLGNRMIPLGTTQEFEVQLTALLWPGPGPENLVLSIDEDGDGVLDRTADVGVEVISFADCNGNGADDAQDILSGVSTDANGNGIPDECEAVCTEAYCRCPVCGDVNGDGQVKVSDLTLFVSYLFRGGSAPVPLAVADVNGDGQVKVSDLTLFVSYLFRGGPPPTCGF